MKHFHTPLMHIVLLLSLSLVQTPHIANAAAAEKAGPPPLVTVVNVTAQNVTPSTEYVGHVEAIQTVDLLARVSGFLEEIHFKEGSNVSAGDLLYVVEAAPYRMKVAVNRARLTKAQVTVKETSLHLKRIQTVRSGGIPVTDIEAAEAAVQQAQAEWQEAQAVLRLSELDLAYTRILAPISGRIGATSLTIGNLCGPTSGNLARIVQLDPIRVLFSISENDIQTVAAAQADASGTQTKGIMQPRIRLSDGNLLETRGRIDFVDNRVDPTTGTIAVRALFDNPDGLLLPGQYIRLVANQAAEKKLPLTPQASVLEDRDGRYVLVVNMQNQVEQRRITTGATVGTLWAVETGLNAGDQVIVQGLQKVKPGQTVRTTSVDATQGN